MKQSLGVIVMLGEVFEFHAEPPSSHRMLRVARDFNEHVVFDVI
jgi:hypothetical protein